MTIRTVRPDEYGMLQPIFKEAFDAPAPDRFSGVVIAEEDGEIIGFFCARMVPYAELFVREGHRQDFIIPRLIDSFRRSFPQVNFCFAVAKATKMQRFLRHLGLQEVPGVPFRWVKGASNG